MSTEQSEILAEVWVHRAVGMAAVRDETPRAINGPPPQESRSQTGEAEPAVSDPSATESPADVPHNEPPDAPAQPPADAEADESPVMGTPARDTEEPPLPARAGGSDHLPPPPPPASGDTSGVAGDPDEPERKKPDQPGDLSGDIPAWGLDPGSEKERSQAAGRELAELLDRNIEELGEEALNKILEANRRFDEAVPSTFSVEQPDGTMLEVPRHTAHRRLLKQLPELAEAAKGAELTLDQLGDLVVHALDSVRFPSTQYSDTTAAHLAKALQSSADIGESLTSDMVDGLKGVITKAGGQDVIEESLAAYRAARKAGLSMEQGVELVGGHLATANYRQLGYGMYHFTEALEALDSAGADPMDIIEVFKVAEEVHPEVRGQAYDIIRNNIVWGVPTHRISPTDMVKNIAAILRIAAHTSPDQIESIPPGQDEPNVLVGDDVLTVADRRDALFREVPGRLENRALPYRTERTLQEGMDDIRRLTHAHTYFGDVVSEGHWVFDPQTNIWYSYGGETRASADGTRYRHHSMWYNPSELSATPYSVHIHPTAFGAGSGRYSMIFPTDTDYKMVAKLLEYDHTPIQLRSIISHPLGFTEFTYPHDPDAIKELATYFQGVVDAIFERYPDGEALRADAKQMGEQRFARRTFRRASGYLPEGFSLWFYPPDSDWERLR